MQTTSVSHKSSASPTTQYLMPKLSEWHIYGNEQQGRFVTRKPESTLYYLANLTNDVINKNYFRILDKKQYELEDHLGNVRVAIGDMKIPTGTRGIAPFVVDEKAVNDYYPYGMLISDRSWSSGSSRYGYNGTHEKDKEINADGNFLDFGGYGYDSRLARRINVEPLILYSPHLSSYVVNNDNPILFADFDGLKPEDVINKATKYIGTPYEYGGRNPIKVGGYPLKLTREDLNKILKPMPTTRATNENYQIMKNEYPALKLIKGNQSLGIDCSGHAQLSFNADPDKLMPDLSGSANDMKQAFEDAEKSKTGYLSDDFSKIKKGDIVFRIEKDIAKHVMVATGVINEIKNKKGKLIGLEIEVIDAQETGKDVVQKLRTVKDSFIYGHTLRKGETNAK